LKNFPKKFSETIKKSSILFIIGLFRLILVKGTNYNYSYSEYGLHWNFFFTIFFVRIFSCPLSIITRKSSLKSFLLSISIGIAYQILLSYDDADFTKFLLDYYPNERETLIEQNKEGNYNYFRFFLYMMHSCYWLFLNLISHFDILKNCQGIASTIGYLSIFLAGEAVCYRIHQIVKEE